MFGCACSLRSTQCAALIALAAAAGLARMDAEPSARAATEAETSQVAVTQVTYISLFFSRLANFNPSLRNAVYHGAWEGATAVHSEGQIFESGRGRMAEAWPPLLVATASQIFVSEAQVLVGRSAANHEIPWAVGPPAAATQLNLAVEGMPMPSDSTTRQVTGSRIARLSPAAKMGSGPLETEPARVMPCAAGRTFTSGSAERLHAFVVPLTTNPRRSLGRSAVSLRHPFRL